MQPITAIDAKLLNPGLPSTENVSKLNKPTKHPRNNKNEKIIATTPIITRAFRKPTYFLKLIAIHFTLTNLIRLIRSNNLIKHFVANKPF